jgi:hypothetical protein
VTLSNQTDRDFRDDPIYARLSRGNGSAGLIARSLRLRQTSAARFARLPYGVLDRSLRRGKLLGERLGFLR